MLNDEDTFHDAEDLSLREIEIIQLIKEGHSSKEIAANLHISVRTAEVHRRNILKKLKLNNTASLINYINNTDLFL
jgi:two-component system invasion response regulator UvrY